MKRAITIACILLAIIEFSFWGVFYVRDIRDSVQSQCQTLLALEFPAQQTLLQQATQEWEHHVSVLGCFIYHDQLDEISDLFELLSAALQSDDPATFEQTLYRLQTLMDRLYREQLPLTENIL